MTLSIELKSHYLFMLNELANVDVDVEIIDYHNREIQRICNLLRMNGFDEAEISALKEEARQEFKRDSVAENVSYSRIAAGIRWGPKSFSWSNKKLHRKLVRNPELFGKVSAIVLIFIAIIIVGLVFSILGELISLFLRLLEYLFPTSYDRISQILLIPSVPSFYR